MTPRPARPRRALVALLIAAVVPLAGCAGKPPPAAGPASGSTSGAGAGAAGSAVAMKRIEVTVAHGTASGDTGRVKVATGTAVTLVVTSDTADEVHVHGYDIETALTAGTPKTLHFTADVPGVFEVELHHAGLVLLHLQVG